jgi:Uma2 family endonuclease
MKTPVLDFIEEYHSEDIMSINHSKIIHRLSVALSQFEGEYDILPELELELSSGKCKPDVCVFPKMQDDWENDIIFYNKPPLIAIEIQSPKQATTDLTDKMNYLYFPSGVKSVWIIVPSLQLITIRTSDGIKLTYTEGTIKDPVTGIEIAFSTIFR